MLAFWTALLSALASVAPSIAAALGHTAPPPVGNPKPSGWKAIDAEEDRAAASAARPGKVAP